jgi:hypothetical protein
MHYTWIDWIIEAEDLEPAVYARVRTNIVWKDLQHDIGSSGHVGKMRQLSPHHMTTAYWPAEHIFVEHCPECRGILSLKNCLSNYKEPQATLRLYSRIWRA